MTQAELADTQRPFLRGLLAPHRAAEEARRIAIETNAGIGVVRDGKTVRLAAKDCASK